MNLDRDRDLRRWEIGEVAIDEVESRHPDQDVRGIIELHAQLIALASEATPDPEPRWHLLEARLQEPPPELVLVEPTVRKRRSLRKRGRVAALGLAAVLTLTSGLAAAGALPAPAQNAIAAVVGHLGLEIPSTTQHADGSSHGQEVSSTAHSSSVEGCQKGQGVAAVASRPAEGHRKNSTPPDLCDKAGANHPSSAGASSPPTNPAASGRSSGGADGKHDGSRSGSGPSHLSTTAEN